MNEHLRRAESARISNDARTRLEGKVELLEDALALLDSVQSALKREAQSPDDAATLREFANQLARIDAAVAAVDALPDGSGAELTTLVKLRRASVQDSLRARLDSSKVDALEQQLRACADEIVAQRTPPSADATRFRESRIRSDLGFLGGGIAIGVYLVLTLWDGDHGKYPYFWWLGVVAIAVTLAMSRRRPAWVLYADALYAHGKLWRLDALTLHPKTKRRDATITFGDSEIESEDLFQMISLLRAPKLTGLQRTRVSKRSRSDQRFRISTPEVELIISADQISRACSTLGVSGAVRGEDLCEALAHLPVDRLRALREELS